MKLHSLNLASGSTTAGVRRGLGHVIVFEVLNAFSISRMDEATLFKFGKSHPKGKKFSTKKAWSGSGDRFYRATRTHSADYAVARCLSVRLSVRHTSILCVNGYIYPEIFSPSDRPHHSGFTVLNWMAIFRHGPPHITSNARGYEKITIFDQYWVLSLN